jgi:phospholipase/carboxylesterase
MSKNGKIFEKVSKSLCLDLGYVVSVGYSNGANIASSTLLLPPRGYSPLFYFVIPFMPEKVLRLSMKNIFMDAGEYNPKILKEQTEMLISCTKRLGQGNVTMAKEFGP